MTNFRFAQPDWSVALWGVAGVVILLLWLDRRRTGHLSRFLTALMQTRLIHRPPVARRWASIGCIGLSATCMVIALMRPQVGLTYQKMPRVGAQVMICLDVSNSMLAEDTAPNRLQRAKADIIDLLEYLEGDQVGLIAFAGRASVLCPLTPDFGFFKLILGSAGPTSVGRGGTRLEEPIRKALRGFRDESDVSRVLLLITDGEDHDSHPLDAAKEAAERGIQILTIGFGDEAGSQIRITNEHGVRETMRDEDGNPVITRLDGQMLRDMALATGGVYIPAGTGRLDLKSIYEAHIAPLVRGQLDDRGRAVRGEAFQWAVLGAVVLLVIGVGLGSGSSSVDMLQRQLAAVLLTGFVFSNANAWDDDQNTVSPTVPETTETLVDPRTQYNQAIDAIHTDADKAESLFTTVRRSAGTDNEVRFRATYNLGWVEVRRADSLIESEPAQALPHLEAAADWFRMAIDLRKDHTDSRHNLEIILRRIAQLRDSLNNQQERSITERLEELIKSQRQIVGSCRLLVGSVSADDDPNIEDKYRNEFRELSLSQRTLLGDAQGLTQSISQELDTLDNKDDEQKTDEERLRAAQLTAVAHYMNRANQRIGQARSQMRRRQAVRAFRRAAIALEELKRARDQLREPLEVLDVILSDATESLQLTAVKAADSGIRDAGQSTQIPEWLDGEYLKESQQSISERTNELVTRLQAALDRKDNQDEPAPAESEDPSAAAFMKMLREAIPFLTRGDQAMSAAVPLLENQEYSEAQEKQREGIVELTEARERFLDIRGLIEIAFATENQIRSTITAAQQSVDPQNPGTEESTDLLVRQVAEITKTLQSKNQERMTRLESMLNEALDGLSSASAQLPPGQVDPQADAEAAAQQQEQQRYQFEQAIRLTREAAVGMKKVIDSLPQQTSSEDPSIETPTDAPGSEEPAGEDPDIAQPAADSTDEDPPAQQENTAESDASEQPLLLSDTASEVDRVIETLQELRRLFFNIVEHLRDTAQRQAQLNDQTEQLTGISEQDEPTAEQTGPLGRKQEQLKKLSSRIAEGLHENEQAQGQAASEPADPDQPQQQTIPYGEAAALVEKGTELMDAASKKLSSDEPDLEKVRIDQDGALEQLVKALELLEPQSDDQRNQQNQDNQQQSQDEPEDQDNQQQSQDEPEDQDNQQQMSPQRLLQMVRDQEQQRRRDQQKRLRMSPDPVIKNW